MPSPPRTAPLLAAVALVLCTLSARPTRGAGHALDAGSVPSAGHSLASAHAPAAAPALPAGQEEIHIPEAPSCPDCEVRLEPEVVLGDLDGPGMLESDTNWVSVDSRGRYTVCAPGAPYFWVFDGDGTILRRVGREGQGPGDFQRITPILIDDEDRLLVFDYGLRRISIFDPGYELVTTVPFDLPHTGRAVMLGDRMVVNGLYRRSLDDEYPLHLVDRDGAILRSFGSETGEYDPRLRDIHELRNVGVAGDDAVWSAPVNEYRIERWSVDGELTHVVRRDVEWFEPWGELVTHIEHPPDPLIEAVSQQGDVLWALVRVPDPRWRSVVRPSGRFFEVLDRHRYVDTVIEAIDLSSRRLIASSRVDRALVGFVGEGRVYGQGMGPDGDETVEVLGFGIVRPNGSP